MDWTTLTASKTTAGSLKNWLNRDTIDPDTILSEAQALIYSTLRHWRMKTEATGALTQDQAYLNVPSDFIDVREFWLTGVHFCRLLRVDERTAMARYNYDSSGNRISDYPVCFYIAGNAGTPRLMLDQPPIDGTFNYLLSYYQKPANLSGSNTTNWLTSFYPRLLRCACMALGVEFEKEAGQGEFSRDWWMQQMMLQLQDVQAKSDIVERASDAPVGFA